jgi:hypothetical protein
MRSMNGVRLHSGVVSIMELYAGPLAQHELGCKGIAMFCDGLRKITIL